MSTLLRHFISVVEDSGKVRLIAVVRKWLHDLVGREGFAVIMFTSIVLKVKGMRRGKA